MIIKKEETGRTSRNRKSSILKKIIFNDINILNVARGKIIKLEDRKTTQIN